LSDPESIIRYAIDHKVENVDVMERLLKMRKEIKQEQAKEVFDRSMKEFQSECPVIMKEKPVPDRTGNTAYKFAPIEAIEVQIRPLLRAHGFSHTFDTDSASIPGWVIAKCIVKHEAGHSETSTVKLPLGTKTAIMSDTQAYAAAYTFANRRALCNAYGLVLFGEDIDGQTGRLKGAAPSKLKPENSELKPYAAELWEVLTPVKGTAKNWDLANDWLQKHLILNLDELAPHNLTVERYKEVIAASKQELEVK
jgi:hypothetical protein